MDAAVHAINQRAQQVVRNGAWIGCFDRSTRQWGWTAKMSTMLTAIVTAALSIPDYATSFNLTVHLPDTSSKTAAQAFEEAWCSWVGISEVLVVDKGTEFQKNFKEDFGQYYVNCRVTPVEAPW